MSGNHPPGTVTLTRSVEILINPILTKSTNEGGKGMEKTQNKCMVRCTKQAAQPHMAGTHTICNSRNPICHLKAHDSLTNADQHWLDFNLAYITFSHIKNIRWCYIWKHLIRDLLSNCCSQLIYQWKRDHETVAHTHTNLSGNRSSTVQITVQYLTIIRRRRSEYWWIFPEMKSRGLFANIHEPEANNCFSIITQVIIETPKQSSVQFYHNCC